MKNRPLNILLIEDDETDYVITRELLDEIGEDRFRLDWVSSFDAGLEAMKRCEHDVCLLDYYLGARNGVYLLREAIEECRQSPVILLTRQDRPGLDGEVLRAGASDYLVKGRIDGATLDRSIRYACERKRSEDALRESAELYHLMFDSNPLPMWVYDIDFSPSIWKRKDGKPITVRLTGQVVRDSEGKVEGFESIVENVTEQQMLEEQIRQSQKMDAIGKLAGGVAHDFNNLLTVINGYSDLLTGMLIKGDPRRQLAEEVKKAGMRAASLTSQLLAFSRKQILQPVSLDLNVVIAESLKMLRRLIGEDIEVITSLGFDLGCVKADPSQIEQVIVNLAINARDAMPEGGKLVIETSNIYDEGQADRHAEFQAGQYVMMSVADTGCGMNEETLDHIFEPFFTTKSQGTGLGLSTVYGIVKQSGGVITVESQAGAGTIFRIYLPRIEEEVLSIDEEGEMATGPGGTETVLLVEDEDMVRNLLREVLHANGYRVIEAANGDQAIELCWRHDGPLDLLITDVMMPQMSGPMLADRLKALQPDMKLLYISGYTDSGSLPDRMREEGTRTSISRGVCSERGIRSASLSATAAGMRRPPACTARMAPIRSSPAMSLRM
jgi:signal transduction histidine kinase